MDQEEVGAEEVVVEVDLVTLVVQEWVTMPLDRLEMEEGITDHMELDRAHHLQRHMAHTHLHHKLPTAVQEDTATLDYRQIHTLEAHHPRQTHMLEMRMERLQQHMEDTHLPHHRHYRGMEMERMERLHLIRILRQEMVEVTAVVMEVEDMVDTAGVEVVMEGAEEVDVEVRWL